MLQGFPFAQRTEVVRFYKTQNRIGAGSGILPQCPSYGFSDEKFPGVLEILNAGKQQAPISFSFIIQLKNDCGPVQPDIFAVHPLFYQSVSLRREGHKIRTYHSARQYIHRIPPAFVG
jgi:hypothetical protein